MNYNINFCKIASEYLLERLKIEQVAERHKIPQSAVVRSLFKYIEAYPDGNYASIIYRKLKIEIVKKFIEYTGMRGDFAAQYGMTVTKLMSLVSDVIQDKGLIHSDNLANTIYIKLISGRSLYAIKYIPPRIINYIGYLYITGKRTYEGLAAIYGFSHSTMADIMRRGISENIFSDQLAEKVYAKVRVSKYMPPATIKKYELAFEARTN